MNVYFDIDGVLLSHAKQVPEGASELLDFATNHCSCYWLTTHCRMGVNKAVDYLAPYYVGDDYANLRKIQATDWYDNKTEALDWDANFVWLDDFAFEFELAELRKRNCLDALLLVDLKKDQELLRIRRSIEAMAWLSS